MKRFLFVLALIVLSLSVFSDPIIGIHSLHNGDEFDSGESILFEAYVADQYYSQFGGTCGYPNNPNKNCFSWYSNIDGFLGHGTRKYFSLSKGTHFIKFSAVNPNGEVTETTVMIHVNEANTPPEMSSLPNIYIRENSGYSSELINLWNYVFDEEDNDYELEYRIINQSNSGLIYCRIEDNKWFECEAPNHNETGSSFVTIQVKDTGGLTDSETVRVEVYGHYPYNEEPSIELPYLMRINLNEDYEKLDLYPFIEDDEDSDYELSLSIEDESNTSVVNCSIYADRFLKCYPYSEGYSYVTVRVEDSEGLSSEDTIKVLVDEDYYNELSFNLPYSWVMSEEESIQSMDLEDYTEYYDLSEVDYSITKETNTSVVNCYITNHLLKCSAKREGYSYVTVKAKANGVTEYDSIKVIVEKEEDSCNKIRINTYPIEVIEGTTEIVEFELENNSNKKFYVNELDAFDNLSWVQTSEYTKPSNIEKNSTRLFKVKVKASEVTRTKTGTAYIKLKGHYYGENNCVKTINYPITVIDVSGFEEETTHTTVTIEKKAITLNKGESETINFIIENNSETTHCFELSTRTTNNNLKAELNEDTVCLEPGEEKELNLRILAKTSINPGWESVTLTTTFGNKTDKQSISVYINGTSQDTTIEENKNIELIKYPTEIELIKEKEISFTIKNPNQETITNTKITIQGLPEGIEFQPIIITLNPNETKTIKQTIKQTKEIKPQEYNTTIIIQTKNQLIKKELKIKIPKEKQTGIINGLLNAINETGITLILGLLMLLAISVIIIYTTITKKE